MNLIADDIMTRPVISVRQDTPVREMMALLHEKQISGVPVVDPFDRLVGVVSMTDLLSVSTDLEHASEITESDFHTSPAMDGLSRAAGLLQPDEAILDHPISDLMSPNVITVNPGATIGELSDKLVTHQIHRVIVVQDNRVVGIVSVTDILRTLRDRFHVSARGTE